MGAPGSPVPAGPSDAQESANEDQLDAADAMDGGDDAPETDDTPQTGELPAAPQSAAGEQASAGPTPIEPAPSDPIHVVSAPAEIPQTEQPETSRNDAPGAPADSTPLPPPADRADHDPQ